MYWVKFYREWRVYFNFWLLLPPVFYHRSNLPSDIICLRHRSKFPWVNSHSGHISIIPQSIISSADLSARYELYKVNYYHNNDNNNILLSSLICGSRTGCSPSSYILFIIYVLCYRTVSFFYRTSRTNCNP